MKITKYVPPSRTILEVAFPKGEVDIISMKRPMWFGMHSVLSNQQSGLNRLLNTLNQQNQAQALNAIGQAQGYQQPQINTQNVHINSTGNLQVTNNKKKAWWKRK